MRATLLRLAIGAVRVWVRIYTWRLPPDLRELRCAELEADIWDSTHDPARVSDGSLPIHIALRLVLGIRDDLGWRFERQRSIGVRGIGVAIATAVVCLLVFAASYARSPGQPPLPGAPRQRAQTVQAPPPPPPPPPPARPTSIPRGAASADILPADEWRPVYALTSYTITGGAPPAQINDVRPVYPPLAIAADLRGTVVVQARITERGSVVDARVVQPFGFLGQSAIDAVRQWQFDPPRLGSPAPVLTVQVKFAPKP